MKLTNELATNYILILNNFLDRQDIIGYAAARNTRRLRDATVEYSARRDELISKYGEDYIDNEGNKTGRKFISFSSPNMREFEKEILQFSQIEHEVDIMTVKYNDVIGKLTGSEILELDWMLED